jgi:hypothetical protein
VLTRAHAASNVKAVANRSLKRKAKGDLAELAVATDLIRRGYKAAFPYGEDWDYDLIVARRERLERIQVKYAASDGAVLEVPCRSHSLTNGKIRATKYYTAKTIDWIAVYDRTSDRCYYISADELARGRASISLRLKAARNGQVLRTRNADKYTAI